jgi:CheY-like chemotaxis protein
LDVGGGGLSAATVAQARQRCADGRLSRAMTAKPYILIADDNGFVRATLRLMLEQSGYEVGEACDGAAALRSYRERPADVVVSDVFMPGKDGLEVIRELRRDFPAAKLVAISGGGFGGSVDLLPIAKKLGASAVLHKPVDRDSLVAAVEALLERPPA